MTSKTAHLALAALLLSAACGGTKQPIQTATEQIQQPARRLAETIVNASFVVEPRTYKSFKLVVGPGAGHPRLEGTFTASGANNDIEVMVLEESQFRNWENRHNFTAAYESGRVTADTIRLELPPSPATYYVVFSNRFSIWSNKGVVADVKLLFERGL